YLEIWPVGFRSFGVMVPNLLNLPILLWGLAAPRHVIGLAMYAASRTAECACCSAHSCSFALRRGAPSASIIGVLWHHRAGRPRPHRRSARTVTCTRDDHRR